jgi:hypothetical protein
LLPEQKKPLPLPSQPAALKPPVTTLVKVAGPEIKATDVKDELTFGATAFRKSPGSVVALVLTFRKISKMLGLAVAV